MASIYNIKNTRTQSIVKIVGSSEQAIVDIATLAYTDQDFDRDNARVLLTSIIYHTESSTNIVRDGNVLFSMGGGGYSEVNFAQSMGAALDEKANADILINFSTGENVVILQLTKEAGYIDPEQQSLQPFER